MAKRLRTGEVAPVFVQQAQFFKQARSIDKKVVTVLKPAQDGTQSSTTLVTATFPCTIVGLRWDLTFASGAGTGNASFGWAIVLNKDGLTEDTLATSDRATYYNPEENLIVYGRGTNCPFDKGGSTTRYDGSTKSMRKLQGGDKLMFITIGEATNTTEVQGAIQFFCKV